MKVRKPKRCARCGVMMPTGTWAWRQYGGYWHSTCAREYAKQREAAKAGK